MERILALQSLSTNIKFSNGDLLGSDDSNICSSESGLKCSQFSAQCQTTDQGTVDFW
jgi:hypothetical protein